MTGRPRVVVVGGGIAGLAASLALAPSSEVVVLEAASRLGGKLVTAGFRGRPLDVGPDNFITRNGAAARLCRALGLGDDLLAPATSRAAIFARGRPRALPDGLVLGVPTDLRALRSSGIVGPSGVVRAALDLVRPATSASAALAAGGDADPTVHEVLVPRLGRSVVTSLVDPLLGGINAGDCSRLSLRAVAPQLASAAARGPSIVRALRAGRTSAATGSATAGGSGSGSGSGSGPLFLGLRGGIESLAKAIERELGSRGVTIRLGCGATGLELAPGAGGGPGRWTVACGDEPLRADAVVLALPGYEAASLLAGVSPELARECRSISYSGVATVTLAWPSSAVPASLVRSLSGAAAPEAGGPVLPASGVLVPAEVGGVITAATFTSTKWPRSSRSGEVVVRASAGRDGDERALGLDDEALVRTVRTELAQLLGLVAPPLDSLVWRFPASFPQYASGHLARCERIEKLASLLPGLALAGAAYGGIGIPACVESGERAAAAVSGRPAG